MRRHIALVGFMAAGKSTIGRKLANKLGCAYYDLDDCVVDQHGQVGDIFETQGEAAFRRYEREALEQLIEGSAPGVIALGGGAVTHGPTLELLETRTYRVFVKAPAEQIFGRLRRSPKVRPVLGRKPTLTSVKELYAQRMPRYADADVTVATDALKTPQIVDQIIEWMREKKIRL